MIPKLLESLVRNVYIIIHAKEEKNKKKKKKSYAKDEMSKQER